MRFVTGLALAAAILPLGPITFAAEVPESVKALLTPLEQAGFGEQAASLSQAIDGAPALAGQLSSLAAAGKLKTIQVRPAGTGPFGGFLENGGMVFTVPFLQGQVKKRLFDVVREDDILPDNLVFCLGHLAYHLGAKPVQVSDAANPFDFANKRIAIEAAAFIQGWNDTLDAEVHANGGKELSPGQAGTLLINLRYRFAFIKAFKQPVKLEMGQTGRIEPTQENINAVAEALKTSTITDLE